MNYARMVQLKYGSRSRLESGAVIDYVSPAAGNWIQSCQRHVSLSDLCSSEVTLAVIAKDYLVRSDLGYMIVHPYGDREFEQLPTEMWVAQMIPGGQVKRRACVYAKRSGVVSSYEQMVVQLFMALRVAEKRDLGNQCLSGQMRSMMKEMKTGPNPMRFGCEVVNLSERLNVQVASWPIEYYNWDHMVMDVMVGDKNLVRTFSGGVRIRPEIFDSVYECRLDAGEPRFSTYQCSSLKHREYAARAVEAWDCRDHATMEVFYDQGMLVVVEVARMISYQDSEDDDHDWSDRILSFYEMIEFYERLLFQDGRLDDFDNLVRLSEEHSLHVTRGEWTQVNFRITELCESLMKEVMSGCMLIGGMTRRRGCPSYQLVDLIVAEANHASPQVIALMMHMIEYDTLAGCDLAVTAYGDDWVIAEESDGLISEDEEFSNSDDEEIADSLRVMQRLTALTSPYSSQFGA